MAKPGNFSGHAGAVKMEAEELQPPSEFPFPFQPYDIQKDFMHHLYMALERGNVGIFESPTGTVHNLQARFV